MARVVEGGTAGLDYLLYPNFGFNQPVIDYFRANANNLTNNLTQAGQAFMSQAKDLFESIYNNKTFQAARNLIKQVDNSVNFGNMIYEIKTLEGLQQASPVMQRWNMACPEIRELYHQQRCDGYSSTYVDRHPNDIGINHYDFRRVMDTVVTECKDGGWECYQFGDELEEGDRDLTLDEKVDILNTWDIMKMFVQMGKEDPTDIYGGTL